MVQVSRLVRLGEPLYHAGTSSDVTVLSDVATLITHMSSVIESLSKQRTLGEHTNAANLSRL